MSFLIDTNVISELRKGDRCDSGVAAWWAGVGEGDLFLSPLVLGEIRKGVELARARDPQKAAVLERWLGEVTEAFAERILPVDASVADEWGRMNAVRPVPGARDRRIAGCDRQGERLDSGHPQRIGRCRAGGDGAEPLSRQMICCAPMANMAKLE